MSTKPVTSADWDTNATNSVAPLAGHISDGYVDDEIPTAGEENGWKRLVGLWTRWLLEGDIDITGAFVLSGSTALGIDDGDNTDVASAANVSTLLVSYNPAQTSGTIKGIADGIDGQILLVVNDPSSILEIYLDAGGAVGSRIALDAPLRILGGAAAMLRYETTSGYWHVIAVSPGCSTLQTLTIPIAAATPVAPATMFLTVSGWDNNSGIASDCVVYPIVLPTQSSMRSWDLRITKGSNGSHTMSAKLWEFDSAAAVQTQVGSTQSDNANAPGHVSIGETVTKKISAGKSYYVQVYGSSSNVDLWGDLSVTYY